MTPDDMVTMIKGRLANSNDSTLDAIIITVANVVQERLEQSAQLPWFLFTDTHVTGNHPVTVADLGQVALPSDFIREDEEQEYSLFYFQDPLQPAYKPLIRDTFSVLNSDSELLGTGIPTKYDIMGLNIYLRKIPDAVYRLRLLYFASDDDIEAGSTVNLWMKYASDWIMAETGLIMATDYVMMDAQAQHFREEAQRAQRRIKIDTIARNEAGVMRQMGDD
jgi:hypothetical protein